MSFENYYNNIIDESINDKGILKALFIVGIPASGKSYTVSKINGVISPRIINSDKYFEFITKKNKVEADNKAWEVFGSKVKTTTKEMAFNYMNSLLPLVIDGTSSNINNILIRMGILESLGYDVGVIFIDIDLKTALEREKERSKKIGRTVDEKFITDVYNTYERNKKYLKTKFTFSLEYDNSSNKDIDDAMLSTIVKKASNFFNEPLKNPIGVHNIESLKNNNEKYLCPHILTKEQLFNKLSVWYL